MKKIHKLAVIAVALAALMGGYWLADATRSPSLHPAAVEIPKKVMAFTLPDLKGRPRNINEWHGKLIILNFWASWCHPCREEIPLLIDIQKKYGKKGLQIIGVAFDKKENIIRFSNIYSINYPLLVGQEEVMAIMERYGNRSGSLPYSVIIDTQGREVGRKVGAYKRLELETRINDYLKNS